MLAEVEVARPATCHSGTARESFLTHIADDTIKVLEPEQVVPIWANMMQHELVFYFGRGNNG